MKWARGGSDLDLLLYWAKRETPNQTPGFYWSFLLSKCTGTWAGWQRWQPVAINNKRRRQLGETQLVVSKSVISSDVGHHAWKIYVYFSSNLPGGFERRLCGNSICNKLIKVKKLWESKSYCDLLTVSCLWLAACWDVHSIPDNRPSTADQASTHSQREMLQGRGKEEWEQRPQKGV